MVVLWTEANKAKAKELWDTTTMTKREIGAVFGVSISAIIGIRYREGWGHRECDLKYDGKVSKKTPEEKAKARAEKRRKRLKAEQARLEKTRLKIEAQNQRIEIAKKEATPKLVHILDIRSNQCREVIGEARKGIMCGRRVYKGSYCKHHAKINMKPSTFAGYKLRSFVEIGRV